ncbi:MAG TPA: hypothetical protein VE326_00460 [Candidatus Binatia bacterium]|nr:hypothetical protein [Candidatus Binatia bacterium]
MRHSVLIPLVLLIAGGPVHAQLNTFYRGVQTVDGKEYPATAQFSIEKGRVAMLMKGARSARMLFLESDHVLRIVDDQTKSYFDIEKGALPGGMGMMAEAEKQLAKLPPEQRKMAEQSMGGMMSMAPPAPTEYVWSNEHQTIGGYDCTRVDAMRGSEKRSEYWGTTSKDFAMSEAERKTMLAMQDYLRHSLIMVQSAGGGSGGDGTRAFQWDTSVDGYPIVTRCFDQGKMTLDLKLESFNRSALSKDLFEIPKGYAKQDLSGKGKRH